MEIIGWVIAHKEDLFAIIGAAVVLASAIVTVTPSRKDDQAVGAVRRVLERFSVVKHSEGVTEISSQKTEDGK